ncbi:hypothetical protein ABZ769_30495 [Streptomyces olivoreticuli]
MLNGAAVPVGHGGALGFRRNTLTSEKKAVTGFTGQPLSRMAGPEPGASGASSSLL